MILIYHHITIPLCFHSDVHGDVFDGTPEASELPRSYTGRKNTTGKCLCVYVCLLGGRCLCL